ncbi:hypothetical protein PR048_032793 [Dryococelus australis]|uniref:Uncharacterized protein n=1 Tax=Dryococelus australis TaxID=614101 RepID=A0ABQ9G366_9NEOP|nr:hypothetical protein PR048_032793 [Dryococelus australis]
MITDRRLQCEDVKAKLTSAHICESAKACCSGRCTKMSEGSQYYKPIFDFMQNLHQSGLLYEAVVAHHLVPTCIKRFKQISVRTMFFSFLNDNVDAFVSDARPMPF